MLDVAWHLRSSVPVLLCIASAMLLATVGSASTASEGAVIPPGQESYFAANVDESACNACGWRFDGAALDRWEARYRFVHVGGTTAVVKLTHASTCQQSVADRFLRRGRP